MSVSISVRKPFGQTMAAVIASLVRDVFSAYRPERHYMRGPGPKWQKKHALHAVGTFPAPLDERNLAEATA